ncbi:ABC transporter ATP-binding protein [Paenibacillus protaetiae]|uniref:ABC transporter ATP-binding protein n=1 Tax=Paenibacillus protaetiae TaxID=2509456 RepID=A0A4P6ESK8_9BACL|nr:ABC transporter ATP-binding protein [Paenibacillus protaetiae]QAY65556.1 ABC transporter ATP-binding protein [Paenibacillus protaetiae]
MNKRAADRQPVLDITRVHKTFGKGQTAKEVIGGLSLHIHEGEFVSIVGPSGSGKTTLFQMIGGLELPSEGEIRVNGQLINGKRGHISYMPQQASLLPWRTVADNVELALHIAGMKRSDAEQSALEWLDKVGLGSYAEAYPGVLSGGMQQRVSFLRALLSPQRLMLLDEPFGALDALTRLNMQRWLMSIWEENRRSVLLVTHSIEEALLLSDRVIVLSASPAVVLDEFEVPFARPRKESLWTDELFNAYKQKVYDLLQDHTNTRRGAASAGE